MIKKKKTQKMSIKEIEVIKKETITKYFCDICDEEIKTRMCFKQYHECRICKRIICSKHSVEHPLYEDYWDTRDSVCTDCIKICPPYYDEIKNLVKKFDKEKEKIYEEMKQSCLRYINEKSNKK